MQIASFLPHYQLVCISFDISSFSLISYPSKGGVLGAKSGEFGVKNNELTTKLERLNGAKCSFFA